LIQLLSVGATLLWVPILYALFCGGSINKELMDTLVVFIFIPLCVALWSVMSD
jgi:hypothetical protein